MKVLGILIFIFGIQSNVSLAGCDPCICGFGGHVTEESREWLERNCGRKPESTLSEQDHSFSCAARGEYRSPNSLELYSFDEPVFFELTLNNDPQSFGPNGNKGGSPLKAKIASSGKGLGLSLHDQANLLIAEADFEEVITIRSISSLSNFELSCSAK